jgi:hypothetical protein
MSTTKIENKGIDGPFFDFMCQQWELSPVHQTMDIRLVYLGLGEGGPKDSSGG